MGGNQVTNINKGNPALKEKQNKLIMSMIKKVQYIFKDLP
jgi:hypothetical protein